MICQLLLLLRMYENHISALHQHFSREVCTHLIVLMKSLLSTNEEIHMNKHTLIVFTLSLYITVLCSGFSQTFPSELCSEITLICKCKTI